MEQIEKNAKCIYTHKSGAKLFMFVANDLAKKRISFGFVVQSVDGSLSNIHYVKRSQLLTSKSVFNFLFDYLENFDKSDVVNIKTEVFQSLDKLPKQNFSEQITFDQLYKMLCDYCRDINTEEEFWVENEMCNIATSKFDPLLKNFDCGYKRLEVLRMLKFRGLLRTNSDRPYDYMRTDRYGNSFRVICFRCVDQEENTND